MNRDDRIEQIHRRRGMAREQGGKEAIERQQHAKGRLSLRERIDGLLDKNSFAELGKGAGVAEKDDDGNLTGFTPANFILGFGKVDGRTCVIGGEDFTVRGGSPNPAGLRKSIYSEKWRLNTVCR